MLREFAHEGSEPAAHVSMGAPVGGQAGTAPSPKVADSSDTCGLRPMQDGDRDDTGQAWEHFGEVV